MSDVTMIIMTKYIGGYYINYMDNIYSSLFQHIHVVLQLKHNDQIYRLINT